MPVNDPQPHQMAAPTAAFRPTASRAAMMRWAFNRGRIIGMDADDSTAAVATALDQRRAARRTVASYVRNSAELGVFLDMLDLRPEADVRYRAGDADQRGFNDAERGHGQ
ncbi:hypothetical protein J7E96_35965 [Streptomyces sp. ISL-96]|uniref:hypothetical protein n=1 Tax=Streptomyces sp. ISL-96 TaxID=2819191 RepID=UPI001BEAF9BE|nr:hypothetical protein [Streptomyces sp. ISL-96]MBT2493800.1 hypothetical protein [Streptomyces sp. ISL-96]